jgi:hypothetical protein
MSSVLLLPSSFAILLAGALLFTNAIEWFGAKVGLGQGAVGSVLAAVATALPESLIPVVAIVGAEAGDEPVLPDSGQCVAFEEEADAAEHLLLLDVLTPGQPVPDALGQGFVEGHRRLLS